MRDIAEIGAELEEKREEVERLVSRKAELEDGEDTEAYDEMLDDCHPEFKVGNMSYPASQVLEAVDKVAYDMGLDEYNDQELSGIEEELDELSADIGELQEELEEQKKTEPAQ